MSSGQAVRTMYLDGRRQWPRVRLEFDAFERHCRKTVGPDPGPAVQQYGADLYLCCACAAKDGEALLSFEREGASVARAAVARVCRDSEFIQETLRELWDKLLFAQDPKAIEYACRGPLNAWIRVAAARTALDRFRAERASQARQTSLSEQLAEQGPGPESSLTRARYAGTFQQALERALRELSSQDRNLLRMHVLGHCSIDQIGRVYRVHRATAARWLERARANIFESVRHQLAAEHADLTDSEFSSIARLMGSELELRLSADSTDLAWSGSHSVT
jgi:RNA polymerase sigma-70 factor (ECF subfamily)